MLENQNVEHSEASKIARFMGLRNWKSVNDIRLVEQVETGLPVSAAQAIVRRIDPQQIHVHVHDIIPKATFYRRKESGKPLTRDESEKVLGLSKVFAEVIRQFGNEAVLAAAFLVREHPLLGGRSPLSVAAGSTAGADLVLDLLARADAGIAV